MIQRNVDAPKVPIYVMPAPVTNARPKHATYPKQRSRRNALYDGLYTKSAPPTTAPTITSTTGFLPIGIARPDCRLPCEPDVVLASSGAPGVTTSTDVIVVLAPPGSVDVNVDVLGGLVVVAELGVVVVVKVESEVLVACVDSEVDGVVVVVWVSVEVLGVTVDSTVVSDGEVGDAEDVS